MKARRLTTLRLPVADLDAAIAFYTGALGFAVADRRDLAGETFARLAGLRDARARAARLRLGDEEIELLEFADAGRPYPAGSTSPDLWFQHFAIVVADMDAAYAHLASAGGWSPISEGPPVTLPASSGGVAAFKFRDGDGHPLELLGFPPDAAPPRWRRPDARSPFLGIDHSAIAVADTARAEAFYVGLLGLSVGSRSVNRGSTQERLDGTFNAVVEVTGLALPDENGPHVELLCNRVPATGRPILVDARANDIAATALVIDVDDLSLIVDEAVEKRLRFVSPGIVPDETGRPCATLRDGDGHLLLLRG